MNLAARIKYWRRHVGMKPAVLARVVGVSSSAVAQWERAKDGTMPNHEHLAAIATAFGISLAEFWGPLPKAKRAA